MRKSLILKIPVKVRDIHKIEKQNSIGVSVFNCKNKEKHQIYVSKKCCEKNHVDLLLIKEKGKKHYVLIKDFNMFLYDHTLHRRKRNIVVYRLLVQKY